jgi:hypothetical protein
VCVRKGVCVSECRYVHVSEGELCAWVRCEYVYVSEGERMLRSHRDGVITHMREHACTRSTNDTANMPIRRVYLPSIGFPVTACTR